jgi:adenine-specific DNA methylase
VKPTPTANKLRGGYYTPGPIADFLVRWALQTPGAKVLEPSAGDGVFLRYAAARLLDLGGPAAALDLTAVEVDPAAAEEARLALAPLGLAHAVAESDFFAYAEAHQGVRFDAVVGNPPFLRYHHFQEEHREPAFRLMRSAGLHPSRLTNAWVPFVVAASRMLTDRGRLAMVLPAELLQVGYAAELRAYLSNEFARITVVAFESLVFEDIQQEVVLLLGEKAPAASPGIRVAELLDTTGLADLDVDHNAPPKAMDHTSEKWTQYFLEPLELEALRAIRHSPKVTRLGSLASVDIGVVTGNNDFFLVPDPGEFALAGIDRFLEPIVTRSRQISGLEFSEGDWRRNQAEGEARYLLSVRNEDQIPEELNVYLETGIEAAVHLGYKCRIRKKWFVVPSTHPAEAFLLRQIHSHPQLALNRAGGSSTDTVHRVAIRPATNPESLATAFHNSLTFAFAEVMGRSYGGGVLELEPSEADALPIPYDTSLGQSFSAIDKALRADEVAGVLDIVDAQAARALDIPIEYFHVLRAGWLRLRSRRMHRRSHPTNRTRKARQESGRRGP